MPSPLVAASAKRALFDRLIDDASLFPPAQLDMTTALRAHRRHAESAYAFVGGRFVVPASRLAEAFAAAGALGVRPRCAVILDGVARDGGLARDLDAVAAADLAAEAFEVRAPAVERDALAAIVDALAARDGASATDVAIEIPYDGGYAVDASVWAPLLTSLARDGVTVRAKLRCGGEAPGATPSVEHLAAALVAARAAGLSVKATAGLHHPVRGTRAGTTIMHGFLNLAVATIALHAGALDEARVADVLAETDPRAFVVDPTHLAWRDVTVAADAVVAGRRAAFAGFGSCSFDEPIDDLRKLGILA